MKNSLFIGYIIMVHSAYFVKSTPLRVLLGSFQHVADMLQTDIEDVHEEV